MELGRACGVTFWGRGDECARAAVESQAVATTILVVEDEIFVRLDIVEILRNASFRVVEAGNADEALAVLNSAYPIDALMTDIRMPGSIDGINLAARIHSAWPNMKIIFVTSHSPTWPDPTLFDLFIGKPYGRARFIERVRQLLANNHAGLLHVARA
jgi:DNA-binding NtrC family response regulator